jgi:hypothetical protein
MYIVYNPKYVPLIEALCASKEAAEAACRGDAALKNAAASEFAAKAAKASKEGHFSTSGLHYVIYHAQYPLRVEALTRTPEMALDIMLSDYVWRVVPQEMGAMLYVCRKTLVTAYSLHFVKWQEEEGSFSRTFTRLVVEFGRCPNPELELNLRLVTIEEYRKISDGALSDALTGPLSLVPR